MSTAWMALLYLSGIVVIIGLTSLLIRGDAGQIFRHRVIRAGQQLWQGAIRAALYSVLAPVPTPWAPDLISIPTTEEELAVFEAEVQLSETRRPIAMMPGN